MLWNRRVFQTRLSHFLSSNLASPLLHHHHRLRNPSIPATLINQPFANRNGVARHSSSKVVKPSEGGNAIGKGMKLHIAKSIECHTEDLKPYVDKDLYGVRADMIAQSALVTRYVTSAWPNRHQTYPSIEHDWVLYSIVVQSPLLRRVLDSMLGYYFGDNPSCSRIDISSEHMEIRAPSHPDLKDILDARSPFQVLPQETPRGRTPERARS